MPWVNTDVCLECGSDNIELREGSGQRCEHTGYADDDTWFKCLDCGASGEAAVEQRHSSEQADRYDWDDELRADYGDAA